MVVPHRSASMDALRRNGLTVWPGMTIFWIGDLAHQGEVSGHNPDDTPRVQAELTDSDTDPEVRALDFMIGSRFDIEDGWDLVHALVDGVDQRRLYYVIYRSRIWRRATGFNEEPFGGANHNDHVHVSGHSSDDANGSDWRSVLELGEDPPVTADEIQAIATAVWGKMLNSPSLNHNATAQDWQKDAYKALGELEKMKVTLDKIASAPPGGLSEQQVRDIVRQELDRTTLGS